MTEERRLELEEKLNMAEASGDAAAIAAVKKTMEHEYRECTSHTADRLKRVEKTVNEIKDGLIPAELFGELKEGLKTLADTVHGMKSDIEAWKNKAKGMKLLWHILAIATAAGGGGILMKLLTASAKATSTGVTP
jgi:hypothetical protein